MKTDLFTKTMSDGAQLVIHSWLPEKKSVKGIVVLSHGMAEHAARYEPFAKLLTDSNIAVYGEDHRGHGQTALLAQKNANGKLGYLCKDKGFLRVVEDIHEEVEMVKELYPGKKVILFGHSFGSFISQAFIENYGNTIDGCVLCGTAGPRPLLMAFAHCLALVCSLGGKERYSPFIDKMAFGSSNSTYKNPRTKYDWLSRDEKSVDNYIADPLCGFVCTVEFYQELFRGLSYIHTKKQIKKIPLDLPVHFIDGTADPVGSYGKTVEKLFNIYRKNGMKNVDLVWYQDARHELLKETNGEEVSNEVLKWILQQIS